MGTMKIISRALTRLRMIFRDQAEAMAGMSSTGKTVAVIVVGSMLLTGIAFDEEIYRALFQIFALIGK